MNDNHTPDHTGPLPAAGSYFYRLTLDRLVVSVMGRPAPGHHVNGAEHDVVADSLGYTLRAYSTKHPSYSVVLLPEEARGDGIRIYLAPKSPALPVARIEYEAIACIRWGLEGLREHTHAIIADLKLDVDRVLVSDLHVRCDVPTPFHDGDRERIRGTHTRNGKMRAHFDGFDFTGFNNLHVGESRAPIRWIVYDKRLEVGLTESKVYEDLWRHHYIEPEQPVWRVECRVARPKLPELGIDILSDLTHDRIASLWAWFTREYLVFVDHPFGRTDRAGVLPKWSRIQAAAEGAVPVHVESPERVNEEALLLQAAGCIRSILGRDRAPEERDVDRCMERLKRLLGGSPGMQSDR